MNWEVWGIIGLLACPTNNDNGLQCHLCCWSWTIRDGLLLYKLYMWIEKLHNDLTSAIKPIHFTLRIWIRIWISLWPVCIALALLFKSLTMKHLRGCCNFSFMGSDSGRGSSAYCSFVNRHYFCHFCFAKKFSLCAKNNCK